MVMDVSITGHVSVGGGGIILAPLFTVATHSVPGYRVLIVPWGRQVLLGDHTRQHVMVECATKKKHRVLRK